MIETVRLILGDQLNEHHSWFAQTDETVCYVMMEILQETNYEPQHQQKTLATFASMRNFARKMRRQGHNFFYLTLTAPENRQSLPENIAWLIYQNKAKNFEYLQPDDKRNARQLKDFAYILGVNIQQHQSHHFLLEEGDLSQSIETTTEDIYSYMAVKYRKLIGNIEKNTAKNVRLKLPKVETPAIKNDLRPILKDIEQFDIPAFGHVNAKSCRWVCSSAQAWQYVNYYFHHLLPQKKSAEGADAIPSQLAWALNMKMIQPLELLEALSDFTEKHPFAITQQAVNALLKALLGDREYKRFRFNRQLATEEAINPLGHHKPLPSFFKEGNSTSMRCIQQTIEEVENKGKTSAKRLLMVLKNYALLAKVEPDLFEQWVQHKLVNATAWSEQGELLDFIYQPQQRIFKGQEIASNIHDCSKCTFDPAINHGEKACPFNGLYWRFIHKNKPLLSRKIYGKALEGWETMDLTEKHHTLEFARNLLQQYHVATDEKSSLRSF